MDGIIGTMKELWPILTGVINFAAAALLLWLQTKFVSKADHEKVAAEAKVEQAKVAADVADHGKRLVKLETNDNHEPTRAELSRVTSDLAARIRGLEASFEAGQRDTHNQLKTLNSYLRSLLENELRGAKK